MRNRRARDVTRRGLAAAAAIAAVALASAGGAAASQQDYDDAYALGTEAYKYGLPLVSTDRTFRVMTSIDRPDGRGDGPVNRFNHVRKLSTPDADTVVAPNEDTLYSIAWLDLRRGPIRMHVPRVRGRYFVLPLMDPYTEDFENLGSVERTRPGDYLITGPGQKRPRSSRGMPRVRSPYDRVWIIARTEVRGRADVKRVRKIQRRYGLEQLGGGGDRRRTGLQAGKPDTELDEVPMPSGLAFFNRLGKQLERFPPPGADGPLLDRIAAVGIGPGMKPSSDPGLGADTRRGLIDAVGDGPDAVLADLRASYLAGFGDHNGWLVQPTGRYGTAYESRAATAQVGLGALTPSESIYPFAQVDSSALPLAGANRYVVHFAAGELPPARAFWSLTMYDTEGFFAPNPRDRFSVGDRSNLRYNPDGSLDVYVQRQRPGPKAERRNWLPAPDGAFRLIMRLYQPRKKQIPTILDGSGWDPPTITLRP